MNFADAFDPVRALQSAWRLLARAPLALFVGGAVCWFFSDSPSFGFSLQEHHGFTPQHVLTLLSVGLCCGIIALLFSSWAALGLAHATEKTMQGEPAQFGDLFATRGRFVDMVLLRVLLFLIASGVCLPFVAIALAGAFANDVLHVHEAVVVLACLFIGLAYLPVCVYVVLGCSLAVRVLAIDGATPTEAVRRSWDLVRGNRLRLFVYWLALWVFMLLGLVLCCVGVVLTGAISEVAMNESYLALEAGRKSAADGPPPLVS